MWRIYGPQRFWATNSTLPCEHQNQLDKPNLKCCVTWLCKSFKFTLSIAVHRGGLAKNHFWLVATQKKRIGEQLNYFWNMCSKPFSWAKNKRKLFSDGKPGGPLLAGAALNYKFIFLWNFISFRAQKPIFKDGCSYSVVKFHTICGSSFFRDHEKLAFSFAVLPQISGKW